MPALIVWGREDALVPVAYASEFGRRIAGSQVEVIGDCGHAVAAEQPARAWTAISAFLDESRVVSASREIAAGLEEVFELIADPARQPGWDGNDNLAVADTGQRVRRAGDVFTMTLTRGQVRENHVVEFEEGRRLAWRPAEVGRPPPGHLWRWELEPCRSLAHPGHLHLRLDPADRSGPLHAGPGDHGRTAPGLARPARGAGRGTAGITPG